MQADPTSLLALLQQADSFFPAGGIAFSWGAETLIAERQLDARSDFGAYLSGQIEQRWALFDRSVLAAAFACDGAIDALAAIDRRVEAMSVARELREGSRRAGASLLGVHERLQTPGAAELRDAVRSNRMGGHLAVVQGAMWRAAGMTLAQAEAASAHGFCVALLGAAMRLGAIGHLQSQTTLLAMRSRLAELLATPALPLEQCYAYAPATEIASMRHEVAATRLFAN